MFSEETLKNILAVLGGVFMAFVATIIFFPHARTYISPLAQNQDEPQLAKYSIPRLRQSSIPPSDVEIGRKLDIGVDPQVYQFFYNDTIAEKRVSGSMMLPDEPGTYPIIILFRGYADREVYYSGYGTKSAAAYFAERGYITLSPDFLGYGASDASSNDSLEARFQTYTTALSLLRSLENVNSALLEDNEGYEIDTNRKGIWAHSNGGQIALTVLSATSESIPTTMWAPVTYKFPDNILYYSDDYDDGGAYLRSIIGDFQNEYDDSKYSATEYFQWIQAPIQLHQGGSDEAVPVEWSDAFVERMKKINKDVTYYVYPASDHNMRPDWETIIARDIVFFSDNIDTQ